MTPSERTERVIFVFAAVFLRPARGFVKRLEQFRETPHKKSPNHVRGRNGSRRARPSPWGWSGRQAS